jgi:hypothetical protein
LEAWASLPEASGEHELRFEFEPHGQPDITQGHVMPWRMQLYIDGALVADADFPYTTPFAFNPAWLSDLSPFPPPEPLRGYRG